jgi:hypothetical protein
MTDVNSYLEQDLLQTDHFYKLWFSYSILYFSLTRLLHVGLKENGRSYGRLQILKVAKSILLYDLYSKESNNIKNQLVNAL